MVKSKFRESIWLGEVCLNSASACDPSIEFVRPNQPKIRHSKTRPLDQNPNTLSPLWFSNSVRRIDDSGLGDVFPVQNADPFDLRLGGWRRSAKVPVGRRSRVVGVEGSEIRVPVRAPVCRFKSARSFPYSRTSEASAGRRVGGFVSLRARFKFIPLVFRPPAQPPFRFLVVFSFPGW